MFHILLSDLISEINISSVNKNWCCIFATEFNISCKQIQQHSSILWFLSGINSDKEDWSNKISMFAFITEINSDTEITTNMNERWDMLLSDFKLVIKINK